MPLTERGLVARYFLDEAASGTTPTQAEDSSGVGTAVPLAINYGSGGLAYTEVSDNRGLVSSNTTGVQRITATVGTTKLAGLNGATRATLIVIGDYTTLNADGSRLIAFNNMAGSTAQLGLAGDLTSNVAVCINQAATAFVDIGTGKNVYHLVVDTTLATAADRVKVYKNGVALAKTSDTPPAQNSTFTIGATDILTLLNRFDGVTWNRAYAGTVYFAAVHDVAFTQAEVSDDVAVLSSDDDASAVGPAGQTWYLTAGAASGSNHGALSATAPGASTSATGHTVGATAASNFSRQAFGLERAAATFSGTAQPSSGPDNALGDCFRTPDVQSGSYAAGDWTLSLPVRADTLAAGQAGRQVVRLYRSTDPTGATGLTEITSGATALSTVSNIGTGADAVSSGTISLGAVTLTAEHVFVQRAWEITGAASGTPATPVGQDISAIGASTAGTFTITLPAHQADDVFLAVAWFRASATVVTPAGWTVIDTWLRGTTRYYAFWRRATSGAETDPVFDYTGADDGFGRVRMYRGCRPTGDPFDVIGTPGTSTADPAVISGITTLTANSLVVLLMGGEDNNNTGGATVTATDPAAFTEFYAGSAVGTDGSILIAEAEKATPGATGDLSVNWATANPVGSGGIALALVGASVDVSTADVLLRLGSNAKLVTPVFTPAAGPAERPRATVFTKVRRRRRMRDRRRAAPLVVVGLQATAEEGGTIHDASVSFTSSGATALTAVRVATGSTTFTGAAVMGAAARRVAQASIAKTGVGTFVAAGQRIAVGSVSLAGVATFGAAGELAASFQNASVAFAGVATFQPGGKRVAQGAVSFSAGATLAVAARRVAQASLSTTAAATFIPTARATLAASVTLAGHGTLEVEGQVGAAVDTSAAFTGGATFNASAIAVRRAELALVASAIAGVSARRVAPSAVSLSARAHLAVVPSLIAGARVAFTASATLVVDVEDGGPDAPMQRTRIALVAVLDTHANLVAKTGRASGNVTSWADLKKRDEDEFPVVAYRVISLTRTGAPGDTRRAVVQLTGVSAASEEEAIELLYAATEALTAPAFAALTPPIDACQIPGEGSERPGEYDPTAGRYTADADLTLLITF